MFVIKHSLEIINDITVLPSRIQEHIDISHGCDHIGNAIGAAANGTGNIVKTIRWNQRKES